MEAPGKKSVCVTGAGGFIASSSSPGATTRCAAPCATLVRLADPPASPPSVRRAAMFLGCVVRG
nr:unnamed protein product [Digitaria exilis]